MSEIFILYRNVKVTAAYLSEAINPDWDSDTIRSKFLIKVEGPTCKTVFPYWCNIDTKELDQSDLCSALQSLVMDAESGSNYDFPEFCSELGYETDSIKARDIFNSCAETAEKLNNTGEFEFGCDREFLDYNYQIHDNRVYLTDSDLWNRPSQAIILFDGQEIEATWEENRSHPGGESTSSMGDGWVDVEHKMPFSNEDVWWTWMFSDTIISSYGIVPCDIRLINTSLSEDDDYYATL